MMLTALILMGNPSCELQLETEQWRPVGRLAGEAVISIVGDTNESVLLLPGGC